MKVKVIKNFYDKTAELALREVGDVLEVDKERAEKLISMKLAEAYTEPETATETTATATVKKKTTTKKTTKTAAK